MKEKTGIISRFHIVAVVLVLAVATASVVAYVWLLPESPKKGNSSLLPTATVAKVDVVPTNKATALSLTPTATTTSQPKVSPTAGAVIQPTKPPVQTYTGPCTARSPYGFTTT